MKELQAKAKVTQTMTRDGLVVENQADGTVENVSSREAEQDYSTDAEGKAEKILERAEDIKDGHKNKKKAKKAAETAATAESEDGLHGSAARLELTEEERTDPALQPYIQKAGAKADKLDAARAALPKKRVPVKEKVYDAANGKAKSTLRFEQQDKGPPSLKPNPASRPLSEALLFAHGKIHEVEHENVGVEGGHKGEELVEHQTAKVIRSGIRHHKMKPYKAVEKVEHQLMSANAEYFYQKSLRDNPQIAQAASNPISRMWQKRRIKQQYAKAARQAGQAAAQGAAATAENGFRVTKLAAEGGERVAEFAARNWKTILIVAVFGLLALLLITGLQSCTVMAGTAGTGVTASSYFSKDKDMLGAEKTYAKLEQKLQRYLDTYEATHNYDEYHFYLDEIEHDPYVLISILSALHDGVFTLAEVQGEIEMLFEKQYILTETVTMQIRYRTKMMVIIGPYGVPQVITYQEPYEYYICTVKLKNKDLSHLPVEVLTEEQLSAYSLYMRTLGNRPDLFGKAQYPNAKLHAIDPTDPEQINRPDSRTREVQAESVAYAVCQHYGLDTSEYSFGYVAGWSSGRELAELKASLEIIRNAAHELISALDEHLAELRQQRETELSTAQEAAFALDNGNILFIQTCDSGYDYTLYDADKKALDGGQLDAPGLTLPDAGQEALNLLGQTAAVSEVLLGDKLAAFQDAAEKTNEIPEPVKIPDPAAEPTVTILWSESDKLQDGEIMPLSVANRVFEELDTAQHTDREKDGYTGGWYDKTAFRIDFTLNGQPDNYEGRQDFGDGEGSLVQHIQNYHEYYAKDENWKNFVLHNKGPEAWEQDKAEREMVLTEFIPYLKQHCNLSAMEQAATAALREGQNISPEQAAYYNTVVAYVQDCRPLLNQGQYNLPEPPKLADFDQSLQDYKAQVQTEIAQEAAAAGMTVEEYAVAGFEAPQQDSFSIYQLRNEDSTRDYRFEPYDRLQAAGLTVDKANYTEVYAAPLTAGTTLEDIYRTFNVDYPADFKGHSLSVSDVVVLHQNGQDTAHYCDSVGFQPVPEFLRENPLRTAELSTEQNENMIDGVLNNAPSLGELEAKAKAGEQISLTDLAAAVKAEEKAPKAKKSRTAKPKKPSIRAQLDAAKKEQSKQTPPREKTKELEV